MAGEIPTKPRKVLVAEEPDILEEIVEMLEANGRVEQKTRDNLLLKAMLEIIKRTRCLNDLNDRVDQVEKDTMDRIELLERRNIATAFIKHPYAMTAIVLAVSIILNLIYHSFSVSTLLVIILRALGIPTPPP